MKKITYIITFLLSICVLLSGCTFEDEIYETYSEITSLLEDSNTILDSNDSNYHFDTTEIVEDEILQSLSSFESDVPIETPSLSNPSDNKFNISSIKDFSAKAYVTVNDNTPYFSSSECTTTSYEYYSPLDSLGRCGVAYACIGIDIMPTEERESIGMIKPSGWQLVKYDSVDGKYLYNRCHLIGYQLSGENANLSNLITGTRFLNVQGMLPFENMVADYIKDTKNHVMYRATPIFEGNNLLATGVLLEGYSVEDNGAGISFNVFCYNAQPGIIIDYSNGDSYQEVVETQSQTTKPPVTEAITYKPVETEPPKQNENAITYILNTNTKKFHYPSCRSVKTMADKNKSEFTGTRDQAISQGYSPCGNCDP